MPSTATAETPAAPHQGPAGRPRLAMLALPLALVAALHFCLWALLSTGLAAAVPLVTGLGIYLVLSACAIGLGLLSMRSTETRWKIAMQWAGLSALGLFSSLLVLALLRAALLAMLGWSDLLLLPWVEASAWGVVVLALLVTVVGFLVARMSPAVVHVDIALPELPAELEGYRIAQITDIHVGPTIRRGYLQRVVDQVNALHADVIAITGDVVDGRVAALQPHVEPLGQLRARDGVALVLGNHELYSGAPEWVQEFRRLGLQVLLNQHYIVQRAGATLAVAGVTDHSTGRFYPELACDPVAALRGAGQTADVRLLLAHQPVTAPAAAAAGYHLALHGHTHGGQWWPWNHFVRMQQPVVRGLHRFGSMWSYTSVGTGYWGPPKRHFRSEITLLTLRPA